MLQWVAYMWRQRDADGFQAWFETLEPGPERDCIIMENIGRGETDDYRSVYELVKTMTNPDERRIKMGSILGGWITHDHEAAAPLVESEDLVPDFREHLRREIKCRREADSV